ncbi:hypothetical protein [Vibrio sp. 16]|uniref:hypothetical protein n=1 Tax=Vibrio sp. 16 TaxID=391586 RepID=UPI0005C50CB1|nr:hypothetical protein [Vibrio sp. 16]CAK4076563.1 hypothetical protein PVDT1_42 [Vibrio sp. 16]
MKKQIVLFSCLLTVPLLALFLFAFLNGSSCRYTVSLSVPDDDRDVFMTCYRGKVVALQTQKNAQGTLLSKWKVEARYFRFGDQSIYFVYSRTPLIENHQDSGNDRFNDISSGYKFLFYKMSRQEELVYIFQTFPRYYVHQGNIDGVLDIWDRH